MYLNVFNPRFAWNQFGQGGPLRSSNGINAIRAARIGCTMVGVEEFWAEFHGFAGADFVAGLDQFAARLNATSRVTAKPGTTRLDTYRLVGRDEEPYKGTDGYIVTREELDRMRHEFVAGIQPHHDVLITGSAPRLDPRSVPESARYGVVASMYVDAILAARGRARFVAMDLPDDPEGPAGPLRMVFASEARPHMAKLNRKEWEAAVMQLLATDSAFATEIAHLRAWSFEWLRRIAERLMPHGLLVVTYGKHLFARDAGGQAWLLSLKLPTGYELKSKVGRGDTTVGVYLAARNRMSTLEALKLALAARVVQTTSYTPGFFPGGLAWDWREKVDVEEEYIPQVEEDVMVELPA